MKRENKIWLTIALTNLTIVALLGFILRSKIVFSLPEIEFKNVLHAHSHFAFGGWITLAVLSLMTYELLPASAYRRKIYNWCFAFIYINACGMLISFLLQGYAFYSILFSTLFIFTTYVFSAAFVNDIIKSQAVKAVKLLSISAIISLVLSSIGPFTLAYLMASKSHNTLLFRDSIYTYLHMQYNGFFTLGVFSLLIHQLQKYHIYKSQHTQRFATMLCASILPSLFISYLWHFPSIFIRSIAIASCIILIVMLVILSILLRNNKKTFQFLPGFAKQVASLSIIAFYIKSVLQMGTIIPSLGKLVFGDRAVIIGYLHLVLLGFISLFLLAYFLYIKFLDANNRLTRISIIIFVAGVIINETILMLQGLGNMLWISSNIYTWLLWGASICLLCGACMIAISYTRCIFISKQSFYYKNVNQTDFSQS